MRGSSPLTRGKPHFHGLGHLVLRLIPAHAGKTHAALMEGTRGPAHPRSRGENRPAWPTCRTITGSSPLTRGKPEPTLWTASSRRLIPAHAGKTSRGRSTAHALTAHPRSRGENASSCKNRAKTPGSSPLTRGKHRGAMLTGNEGRLIPAHAGKTSPISCIRSRIWAHPRSRGENQLSATPTVKGEGSSPLTRGKLRGTSPTYQRRRLIPAHAGKTFHHRDRFHILQAHPRSRGENASGSERVSRLCGSSPLTRGKLTSSLSSRRPCGLIPAHAGKTRRGTPTTRSRPAHPRSRGENPPAE